MYMRGLIEYAEKGILRDLEIAKKEVEKLEALLVKLRNGRENDKKAVSYAMEARWTKREEVKPKRKFTRKQLLAARRNAKIARAALAARRKNGET